MPYKNEEAQAGEDSHGAHVCNIWNQLLKKVALKEFVKVEEGQVRFF